MRLNAVEFADRQLLQVEVIALVLRSHDVSHLRSNGPSSDYQGCFIQNASSELISCAPRAIDNAGDSMIFPTSSESADTPLHSMK